MKIEKAPTSAVDALEPYVGCVLRAIAETCEEPGFAAAFVTDESWLSDFALTKDDYTRLSEILGIQLDPDHEDGYVIYRIAAKLRERDQRATC